jgi:hypothetical protein
MEPYLNFAVALMQGNDPAPELEAIRQLPVEKRYVWRVAAALKWGFADFDDLGVDADRQTLSPEDTPTNAHSNQQLPIGHALSSHLST